ncbi:ABC transporter substrate-binding protein [Actinocrispum wychmicini]|uniref:Peptide/nickel transport system substrate-binding protein n=1 Tax=Actinocrispum wychmicini TaxID=1213861 RepID=A0A4V2S7N3_9PSEU|nr:ABC transporter substrate-binding protein [Actinocrispum wychmicini]TCO60730.1 peptide/nickel transport system substrate-binding protein [Actinocrispum wychmicini]
MRGTRAALLGVCALVVVACGTTTQAPAGGDASADRSGSGGTLVIGMSGANVPIANTPPSDGAEGVRWVGNSVYDALTAFDLDQSDKAPTPGPWLAESWTLSPDKLAWTFKLRKGVKFQDGTDFNADAVVFQLDRITKKDSPYFDQAVYINNKFYTQYIASYRAVDPTTVEIRTAAPYSLLLWDLTSIYFPSPAAVKQYGNRDYPMHAVGTGPFKMTRYVQGSEMELDAFDGYWGGRAKLDKIRLRVMPDAATRLAALQSGDINWAEVPPPDSVPQLKTQGFNVLLRPYPHTMAFYLNNLRAPFNNPKVREALQYAINREAMCNNLLSGLCTPATQTAYEGHPWFDPVLGNKYHYDPAKAKQLLAEGGYAKGLTMTVAAPTGGSGNMWPGPMLEFIQSNLKDVGVDMKIVPLEWNLVVAIGRAGFAAQGNDKYDAIYNSISWGAPFLADRYSTARIPPGGCCNTMGYSNPEVDKAFQAVQSEFDPKKADALMAKALGLAAADSPATYIVHDLNLRVLSPKVRGFVQPQAWYVDLRKVWVKVS